MRKILYIGALAMALKLGVRSTWGREVRQQIGQVKTLHESLAYIPTGLVMAMAMTESSFNPRAVGAAGERGLMQVMPPTFEWIFRKYNFMVPKDPFDPVISLLAGMLYVDTLYKRFNNWFAVIHAYNVGAGGYATGKRNWPHFFKVIGYWVAG